MNCVPIAKFLPQGMRRGLINKTAKDNAPLFNLIFEEKDVAKTFSKFVDEQKEATAYLTKWADKEEEVLAEPIRAYHTNMTKINEYAAKWSAEYAQYIAEVENILGQVKVADELKAKVASLEKALKGAQGKLTKAEANEKNPSAKPDFDANKAKQVTADARKAVERATTDLQEASDQRDSKVADLTTFKAVHIKAGLLRLTKAYVEYHQQTAALMESQIATIEAIPGEVTPEMLAPAQVPEVGGAEGDEEAAKTNGDAPQPQENGNGVAPAPPADAPEDSSAPDAAKDEAAPEEEEPKSPEPKEEAAPEDVEPEAEPEAAPEAEAEAEPEAEADAEAENKGDDETPASPKAEGEDNKKPEDAQA